MAAPQRRHVETSMPDGRRPGSDAWMGSIQAREWQTDLVSLVRGSR